MNYRFCQGMMLFSETADSFYFKESDSFEVVTSLTNHSMTIYFRKGQNNTALRDIFPIFEEQLLTEGNYSSHSDCVYWNGARLFNKTDKPWVSLFVFLVKDILVEPIIYEQETNTVIVVPNTNVESFKTIASTSKNFYINFGNDFHVSNLLNLYTQGNKSLNLIDTNPYEEADFSVTSLDYLEAFRRYIEYALPDVKVVHKDSDEQVKGHHKIITIGLSNSISNREEIPTHVMHDDKLGAFMRVSAQVDLEFLSDDLTYAQQFEHDYNSDLGIRTIQSFTIKDEYTHLEEQAPILSPSGWSATVTWKDFIDFDTDARTQAKTFSGSTMYSIPFSCNLSFFIVKGRIELPSILRYVLDSLIRGESDE